MDMSPEFLKQISEFEQEILKEFEANKDKDPQIVALEIIKRITGASDEEANKYLKEIIDGINTFYSEDAKKDIKALTNGQITEEQLNPIKEAINENIELIVNEIEASKKQGGE